MKRVGMTAIIIAYAGHARIVNTMTPKVGSIMVTMAWNYAWYSRLIFKDSSREEQVAVAIADA